MLVRDLKRDYPQIYALAEANIMDQHPGESLESYQGNTLSNSMVWGRTPEGGNFWNAMNGNRVEDAKHWYPSAFDPIPEFKNGVKVTKNGLLK